LIASANLSTWFPEPASTHAARVDGPFLGVAVVAVCALVLFVGLALVMLRQYRRQDRNQLGAVTGRPNPVFLTVWLLGAVGMAIYAFVVGMPGFIDQNAAPYGAYQVNATAYLWGWDFVYPNGHAADTLHVPVNRPVLVKLTTPDVAHSFAVPALRLNVPILPGQDNEAWFMATRSGTYEMQSNTFSGDGFAEMKTQLVVHEPGDFATWLGSVSDIFVGRSLEEVGELLVARHGCAACHSVTGVKVVGPSFKDLYGFEFDIEGGGRVVADEAYIRDSILTPNVSVIAGYQPVMTPYEGKLTEREIEAITAWLKTLSSKGGTTAATVKEEN